MATLWQRTKGAMLDTLGNTLIPTFLNWVKGVWQHHPIDIHPETQALIDAGQPLVFMVWHDEMYTLLHKFWQTALPNIPHILISLYHSGGSWAGWGKSRHDDFNAFTHAEPIVIVLGGWTERPSSCGERGHCAVGSKNQCTADSCYGLGFNVGVLLESVLGQISDSVGVLQS